VARGRVDTYNGFKLIELIRQHIPHDFDPKDFLLAGSARLWAGGLQQQLSDVDILARPGSDTWRRAVELAFVHAPLFGHEPLRASDYTGDKIARLYGGVVEVCDTWVLPGRRTGELIDAADAIDGLRYLTIEDVIAYKRYLDRPKDVFDLAAIERRLGRPS
jgi:hypothetical protein